MFHLWKWFAASSFEEGSIESQWEIVKLKVLYSRGSLRAVLQCQSSESDYIDHGAKGNESSDFFTRDSLFHGAEEDRGRGDIYFWKF